MGTAHHNVPNGGYCPASCDQGRPQSVTYRGGGCRCAAGLERPCTPRCAQRWDAARYASASSDLLASPDGIPQDRYRVAHTGPAASGVALESGNLVRPAAGATAASAGVAPACAGLLVVRKPPRRGVLSASMSGMLRVLRLCSVFEPRDLTLVWVAYDPIGDAEPRR